MRQGLRLLFGLGFAATGFAQVTRTALRGKFENNTVLTESAPANKRQTRRLACDEEYFTILSSFQTNPFARADSGTLAISAELPVVKFEMTRCSEYVTFAKPVGVRLLVPSQPGPEYEPICVRYDGTSWTVDGTSVSEDLSGTTGAMICNTMHSKGYYVITWMPIITTSATSTTTSATTPIITTSATSTTTSVTTSSSTISTTTAFSIEEYDESGSERNDETVAAPVLIVLGQIFFSLS